MATGSRLLLTRVGYRNKDLNQMLHNPGKHSKQQRKAKQMAVQILRARLKEELNLYEID